MPVTYAIPFDPETVWSFLQGIEDIGIDVAVQTGVVDVWGAWTQLSAITVEDIYWLNIGIAEPDSVIVLAVQCEIGIGAALAEVAVAGGQILMLDGNEDIAAGGIECPCYIPAGSRVAMRLINRGAANVTFQATVVGSIAP